MPAVSDHCPGGVVSRRDGAADPFRTTQAFRRRAVERGAEVIEGVRVTGLARQGSVWRVETSDGPIEAPKVVNAAGAWADRIAAQLGEPVPLEVIAPMLMVSSRVPPFIDPVVILRGRKLSFKQLANGTVVIGGGHLAVPYRDENRTVLDWTKLATSARTVWELFPVMREATIVRAWAGIEARMPDDIPVVGPSAHVGGRVPPVRLLRPRLPARPRDRRGDGRAGRDRQHQPADRRARHRKVQDLKHRLLAYAGLARPYRFERTLAVLAALSLAVVIAAAAIHFCVARKLPLDSPRSWYFIYMAALVVLALLLVPWPRLAAVVLSLATLEAAFGLGTAYLYKVGLLDQTVFPREDEAERPFPLASAAAGRADPVRR